ncbi:MAG: sensor histidine kinase [Thermoleophilaceae bacterium]
MRASLGLLLLLTGALASGLAFWIAYGAQDGLTMALLMVACGAPAVVGAHVIAARRRSLGGLSRQFAAGVGVSVALTVIGVAAIALLMFVSAHDAFTMAVLLVFAGGLTGYTASVLARSVMHDIEAVGEGVRAVGEGQRELAIETAAHDEIAELAQAAEAMARRLGATEAERETAEGARRDLIAAVSHDLRTPLTSLRLLADAIADDVGDQQTRATYLARMSVHIASLSSLVEDLFELSRLEAGEIRWSMQRVALGELVEETVEAMRPQAETRRVDVRAEVNGDVAPARADPEKLQRVLFNLIHNAIRHTPADGSVTVAAQSDGDSVEVEVADTGEGLAPAERERAFEPFFRGGDQSARSADGTGLGLTICRAIVEAHGGRIWFAESDGGARVRFSLPKATQA